VHAEDGAVLLGDDLDHPAFPHDVGLGQHLEVELGRDDLVAAILGLALGQTHRRDLGRGEGDPRDPGVVDLGNLLAGDALGHGDPLEEGGMRELKGSGRDVPDGPDVRNGCLEGRIDLHVTSVELDAGLLVPEPVADRPTAHRHEAEVGAHRLGVLPLGLVGDLDVVARVLHLLDLDPGDGFDPTLLESSGGLLRDVLVLEGGDAGKRLQHGHLRPERVVNGGELQADGPGPDDHH
jgi:hypothetical protein